jgi:DNA polymerase I-like protein with 3'-5' exonuclease and polymerase domains/5'-3' exonuclease
MQPPTGSRLFLVDGYALIYRAFFALISRPLTTGRGENTSAVWGIANFLQRLLAKHRPDYLGWVHDSGLSFRHEAYPGYKATREKLTEELQSDFDRGMERISELLAAYDIPVLTCPGYEADDVIGTLARQGAEAGVDVIIVSGDKDFQQLVRPHVWLLNPGRGGPASVEEQWVGVENAAERLGVPPERVTDYLALVGDSSDNVPGVKGIGEKTACTLVAEYGPLEEILAHAADIKQKRPREALLEHGDLARLSKRLVTIHDDLPVTLDLERLKLSVPDWARLRDLFVELEFHTLAREAAANAEASGAPAASRADAAIGAAAAARPTAEYTTVDTVQALQRLVARARKARHIAVDTEVVIEPDSPSKVDPLRSRLVGISMALAPGEAYYLPFGHREYHADQGSLSFDGPGAGAAAGDGAAGDGGAGDGTVMVDGADDGTVEVGGGPPRDGPGDAAADTASDLAASTAGATGGKDIDPAVVTPPAASDTPTPLDADDEPAAGAAAKRPRKSAKAKAKPAGPAGLPPTSSIAAALLAERRWPVRNLPPLDSPEVAPLRELLEDPAVRKTMQNAKFDLLVFRRAGVDLQGVDFDTMLASYVLDPGRRSHGLDMLAIEFLQHRMTGYEELCGRGKTQLGFDEVPIPAARDYSAEDADMTLRLRELFEPQLEEQAMAALFREIEMPLVPVLADMELAGVSIDVAWFRSLKERFRAERERVEREIYAAAGEEFNINSNPQLRVILFDKLGLPSRKRTATGPSTDASVLQELADEGYEIPSLLMEYRELFKLEGTYLDALPALVNPHTGRLHTSFNQTVASTGRLSSSDPNLQNIPIRRELGRDIRRGFVPRKGWRFVAADYSQIELRLLAHLSHDPAFVGAFNAGGDIHRQTAAVIFGVPLETVTGEMRARAKTINFATIYGQGAHALSRQLKISNAEARAFIDTYFERFRGVKDFLDSRVEYAREHGYAETIFGRRRYVPELRDRNFNVRAFGERVAQNAPIQGSAADLIKIAMIRIATAIAQEQLQSHMILQVHDELVFEVPPQELDALQALVVREMEHAAELSVPLVVDVGVGENWLETKL